MTGHEEGGRAANATPEDRTPSVHPQDDRLSRENAWVEMKLRMIQRRCREAVDVLNDLTPQHHDAAYKMGYASHALSGIIEDIDFTLSMRGQVELFSPSLLVGVSRVPGPDFNERDAMKDGGRGAQVRL